MQNMQEELKVADQIDSQKVKGVNELEKEVSKQDLGPEHQLFIKHDDILLSDAEYLKSLGDIEKRN